MISYDPSFSNIFYYVIAEKQAFSFEPLSLPLKGLWYREAPGELKIMERPPGNHLLRRRMEDLITGEATAKALAEVRRQRPLVHNITNYVVMNITANALLAIGASPVMAHAEEEVAAMVSLANALVINIGTLSAQWVRSMLKAARVAVDKHIPVIIDPVGAGATPFRTQVARELIETVSPAIIRGNPSEIRALAMDIAETRGVDSVASVTEASAAAEALHRETGAIVCISGEVDYIIGSRGRTEVHNGHPLMATVTGLGCTATALCGAMAGVIGDYEVAAVSAMVVMGVVGEMAAKASLGPGSLQVHFLDTLYQLQGEDLLAQVKLRHG